MTVEINTVRKAVEVAWDTGVVEGGRCSMRAENVETGGASTNASMPNDGFAVLTYPLDFKGETHITIEGDEGGKDEGTVTIGKYVPEEPGEGGPEEPGPPLEIWGPIREYIDAGFPAPQPHPDHELPAEQ